jgi:hypothetical protein
MMKFTRSLGLFSGLMALAILGGCLADDDPAEGNGKFSVRITADVVDIEAPDAEEGEPGLLVTTQKQYSCSEEGEVEEHESEDSLRYAINDGFLYLWSELGCTATKLSGSSSTLVGTWKSEDLSVRIPLKYRPEYCEGSSPGEGILEVLLENPSVAYTISSTKVEVRQSGTLCLSPFFARQFGYGDDVVEVSSECGAVKLKNEEVNRTATLSYTLKGDSLVEKITYNGKTCRSATSFYLVPPTEPPLCLEEGEDDYIDRMIAHTECLEESEFAEDFADWAKAAAKRPRLARPR